MLQQRYLGNKRFSLEGVTALIPLIDEILEGASQQGLAELVMGMSHRGRLNVIVQVARRAPEEVFAGFEDIDPRSVLGSGDVKYHMGATGEYITRSGAKVHIHLVSNPSHLEAVDPVTIGRTRAKHDRTGEDGTKKYLPLLVHGDAAFAGQGIVAETLNYADLPGYTVGGTVHIIANNLIGFTTVPANCIPRASPLNWPPAVRSYFSCERRRRGRGDPRGPHRAEYRYAFGTDVVVDLIGYRRHGHSEVDDPTITQPLLYKAIKEHPPLWEIYSEDIGVADAPTRVQAIRAEFEAAQKRPVRSQKSPRFASCRPTGTITRAAATSRSMTLKLDYRPKNCTKSQRGSRLIRKIFTSIRK